MKNVDVPGAMVVAAIITLLIRLTLFGDDCNLLVVLITFVVSFVLVCVITILVRTLSKRL